MVKFKIIRGENTNNIKENFLPLLLSLEKDFFYKMQDRIRRNEIKEKDISNKTV